MAIATTAAKAPPKKETDGRILQASYHLRRSARAQFYSVLFQLFPQPGRLLASCCPPTMSAKVTRTLFPFAAHSGSEKSILFVQKN
ncbi:MAG TPA: hypothetical protein VFB55_02195 [Verrucomicrobiae bacterium]|nr:hypothetical protein [Verrucomicrobiae bacterium]